MNPTPNLISIVRTRAVTGQLRTAQDILFGNRHVVEDHRFYDFIVNQESDFVEFFINKPLKLQVVVLTLEQNEKLRAEYQSLK